MSKKLNRAYWMLADTELPIAKDLAYKSSFEAHFKHGLLFNERLMISDAQAVNCVNFRTLINESEEFKQLMTQELLSIAVRDPLGTSKCDRLTQVRDAFYRERKNHMPQERFLSDSDLDLLNENCEIIPYTYSSLRDNYTEKIFEIFKGKNANEVFGNDIQKLLVERLLKESERDQGLGRVFLHKNFESDLKKIGKHEVWDNHKNDIIRFSDAPYVTGLSKVLNTNPIYSPLHKNSFELAFPKKPQVIEKSSTIEIATNLNLSSYEIALSKLMPEDILFLRDSFEFKEYQKSFNHGVSNENSLENTLDALIAYQNLIDQYILRRHLGLKTSKQFKGKRFLEPMRKVSQESGAFALGLALTDVISGGALSIVNFFVSECIDQQSKMTEQKMTREKYKLQAEIENSTDNNKIKAQYFTKNGGSETIYTSIGKF